MLKDPFKNADVDPAANLKVHQPEPEPKKVYGTYEDIVFNEDLIARMMANMASHGMTLEDLAG